jgi:hypothetical protein
MRPSGQRRLVCNLAIRRPSLDAVMLCGGKPPPNQGGFCFEVSTVAVCEILLIGTNGTITCEGESRVVSLENGRVPAHIRKMDRPQIEAAIIMFLIAGGSATFTALMLGYVAHYNFGLSRQQIRTPAVLGAVIIAVLIAVDFFCKRLRRP